MKRESNDPQEGSQQGYENERQHQGGDLRDGSPADSPNGVGSPADLAMRDLDSWSKDDFEAALPLYVGGDLDGAEATRVDEWLAAHPEDQKTLAASEAAAGVLARFAQDAHQRETPDLWAGIRKGLVREGLVRDASPASVGDTGRFKRVEETPILGGPRWFQRKSVAAAAALLLTGSAGLFMISRGEIDRGAGFAPGGQPASVQPAGGSAPVASTPGGPAARKRASVNGMHLTSGEQPLVAVMGTDEHPLGVMTVGSQHGASSESAGSGARAGAAMPRGKAQRLQRPGPGAERLIDDAPNVLLWQYAPWVEPSLVTDRRMDGAQLTSGR